ncbi:xanthine dehydrogenase accessory protein XdhC [Pseudophaeobacter flagellatus]|uniref:xanthine dehydrogenase accessory protein XdhC n=1 Tax=Pseudophaeobacter flagellatus TaxID=2899119 RepID=UPI001E3E6D6E|nr:xanthine dehydrogenase accessory protein XdhC [Pseudophaeobacter flagellatus]MCD9149929.1 xanthine dehydrogenase accessory protein XdhC [Pseudophaeobacter flagellatus]
MGFDLNDLRQHLTRHGRVVRVVIASIRGSSPREVGAAMLVWDSGQSGTIGGGALEYEAAAAARRQEVSSRLSTHALGPDLGQCCGGSVTLVSEVYTKADLAQLEQAGDVIARPVPPTSQAEVPLAVKRLVAQGRGQGQRPAPQLIEGWMLEPVHKPQTDLWIWGAGHVGRALVDVLSPLPDLAITWIDTSTARYPAHIPPGVTQLPAATPPLLLRHAPVNAQHLVLTYSHELDLALCHGLLSHGFSFAGLIGSATKWARFRSRLAGLGHSPAEISRITCPIGAPALGKHPQMIAVGVAAELLALSSSNEKKLEKERRA